MSVFLDTSAVVAAHVDCRERAVAVDALADADPPVCVSALALTEALAMVAKLTDAPPLQAVLEDAIRRQWDRYAVIPVDQRCLDRAAGLLRAQPLRLADAIHLGAADRLPRPVCYVTFDPGQIPVALGLAFDVVSL